MTDASTPAASQPSIASAPSPGAAIDSPLPPAVARCADALMRAYKTEYARRGDDYSAAKCGKRAFRGAMPPLIGHENIRDFIACTAQGVLLEALDSKDASKLLYAAQVALGAIRAQPAKAKSGPA
ncbi:MAG: hypothetical protein WAM85_10550 [Terracidiphilus sp.]